MNTTENILQALIYLLQRIENPTKLQIVKLLFLADKLHLIEHARTITGDRYVAMPHGPVCSQALDIINQSIDKQSDFYKFFRLQADGKHIVISKKGYADFDLLSDTDKKALDKVVEIFGQMSGKELERYTHQYDEWKKHAEIVVPLNTSMRINPEDMFSVHENDQFNISPDVIEHSKRTFKGLF